VRSSTSPLPGAGSGTWSKTILLSRITAAFIVRYLRAAGDSAIDTGRSSSHQRV
jgi:hypothetical protein